MSLDEFIRTKYRKATREILHTIDISVLKNFGYKSGTFDSVRMLSSQGEGIIREDDIEMGLIQPVFRKAINDYDTVQLSNRYDEGIDNIQSRLMFPRCFAYGLINRCFTGEEISQIPFNVEDFVRTYGDDTLLPRLTDLILNYDKRKKESRRNDFEPILL